LKSLFEAAYLNDNLGRQLANSIFGTYGLVILDADDADLKRPFTFAKKELLHQTSQSST
jgi:hypothetical protein